LVQIAFYAPMKSPNSSVPSGDRTVAQLLIQALEYRGHQVTLASSLRSWDGSGDENRQRRLRRIAQRTAKQLILKFRQQSDSIRPQLWLTYHVYHKAPDWIGPMVSAALGIPYIIAEASYAPKQAKGPWHEGHKQTEICVGHADAVFNLNSKDFECIQPLLKSTGCLTRLRPFLAEKYFTMNGFCDRLELAQSWELDTDKSWLITVAMMRYGDKFNSYQVLSEILRRLKSDNWQLVIVGDGQAQAEVRQLFSNYSRAQLRFVGRLLSQQLYDLLHHSDLFVWPAINEAYGMALLEAQACGLPVIAGNNGGVPDIVAHNQTGLLSAVGDSDGFARNVDQLLTNINQREIMAKSAIKKFKRDHTLSGAATIIDQTINALLHPSAS